VGISILYLKFLPSLQRRKNENGLRTFGFRIEKYKRNNHYFPSERDVGYQNDKHKCTKK
jgi:hypothetical protein